jgi:hypothetical protein
MYKCLKRMNFGNYFIHCVETMYNQIQTCVINSGYMSSFFKPSRGLRQGCPLSPYLFVIIVEVLAQSICLNQRINGLNINNNKYKICQYADDTCFFLADQESLLELDLFGKCSR